MVIMTRIKTGINSAYPISPPKKLIRFLLQIIFSAECQPTVCLKPETAFVPSVLLANINMMQADEYEIIVETSKTRRAGLFGKEPGLLLKDDCTLSMPIATKRININAPSNLGERAAAYQNIAINPICEITLKRNMNARVRNQ